MFKKTSPLTLALAFILTQSTQAQETNSPSATAIPVETAGNLVQTDVIDEKSPEFLLGKATRPNLMIRSQSNPDMNVSLGVRFQGTAQYGGTPGGSAMTADAYSRRVRFEISTQFSKNSSFVMDIRNDNANRGDSGERSFNVGDAYFVQKKLGGLSFLNLKAFRGKVDVSRSETAKSSWQIYYDRTFVADEAAQYVNHNRRATNVQLFGDWNRKVAYSVALGDGVASSSFHDASGDAANSVSSQNPMFGGKIVLSPLSGWEETERTETYFGQGQHLSAGVAAFHTGNIVFRPTSSAAVHTANRTLLNFEASGHYRNLSLQAEYFRFSDVIKNYASSGTPERGNSQGWYVVGEYVMPDLWYLAPFARYEHWNRFESDDQFLLVSRVVGLNWYLRGNTTRVGLAVQSDSGGADLGSSARQLTYKFVSQIHF